MNQRRPKEPWPAAEIEGAWVSEVRERVAAYRRGEIAAVAAEEVLAKARKIVADACLQAVQGIDEVYALAADMGGIGFIETHKATIVHNNGLINAHTLEAARLEGCRRLLYTSSACI